MFGLSPDVIRNIKKEFSKFPQIEKVILYGSRAKGNYKDGSDIDVTLIGKNLNLKTVYALEEFLEALYLPYSFDISIFTQIDNDDLIEHILNVGKDFYIKGVDKKLHETGALSLPEGWSVKKLGEAGKIFNGNSINAVIKKEKYLNINTGIPYIATKDISYKNAIDYDNGVSIPFEEKLSFKFIPKNTVLICAEGGSAGRKIAFTNQEVCFGNKLFALIANNNIDSKYVYYFYFSSSFQKDFQSQMTGIIGGVSMAKFKKLNIPLPPLPEQKRIVAILGRAFKVIDQAKTNAEQNLKNAKELFESYLQNIFENKGDDWVENTLGEVLQKTKTVNPKLNPDEEFTYIDVSSVNKETKLIEKPTILLGKDAPSRARKLVQTDDIIFATVRPTHSRVAIITEKFNNQICSTGYYVLKPKDYLNNHFVFYFLLTHGFNKKMESMQKGASYPAVTNKEVESVFISFPKSNKEQQEIVNRLEALQSQTKKLEVIYQQKIADLEELKKSILQKAFNGELSK